MNKIIVDVHGRRMWQASWETLLQGPKEISLISGYNGVSNVKRRRR